METERKKLLVTASTFPRWEGDTEPRFILDLVSHMTKEFDVTVLAPAAPGAKKREVLEGVKVIRYHYFPIHKLETLCYPGAIVPRIKEKKIRIFLVPCLLLSLWWHLLKLLPEFDIVHAHWLIPQGIIQSFFKKPYIVTGHGGDVTSLNKGIFKTLKCRCIRHASQVIVVSDYLKQKVQELVPECVPEVISMGIDITKFGKQYYVPNYFEQGNKKVVIFVGRLVEIKGVTYLIEAMKSIENTILIIVGDGPLREQLQQQAKEQGEKIQFIGAKTHDELKIIYASADAFVAPSITEQNGGAEGLGLTLLEAMVSGIPVISTKTGGITSIIHDRVNGLLCDEKDVKQLEQSIKLILNDDVLRNNLILSAEKTIAELDYEKIADKYIELFKKHVS